MSHPGYGSAPPAQMDPYGSSPGNYIYPRQPNQYDLAHAQYQEPQTYGDQSYNQPDFLPQLPPSNRPRNSLPLQPRQDIRQARPLPQARSVEHVGLPHSHSSPAVPTMQTDPRYSDDAYQLRTDFPDPIPDVEYQYQRLEARPRMSDVSQDWQVGHWNPQEEYSPPPPPPMHSHSSPAVPQRQVGEPASSPLQLYGTTPPSARHTSVPNSSPLQSFERKFCLPRSLGPGSPSGAMPIDTQPPSSDQRLYNGSPSAYLPGQTPSPFARPQPASRTTPNRHSIADPYTSNTPTRPHPLSQEVPQTHSPPQPMASSPQAAPYPTQYRSRDGLPLIRPRPVSPQTSPQPSSQPGSAPRSKSSYDIQFPVRAFESSDNSPLSMSQSYPRVAPSSNPMTPIRKSMSPHSTPPHSAGAIPYSPDSFNVHNPNAQPSTLSNGNSPHSPYQVRPGSEASPREEPTGPILDSHGNEVDPSDRLPVHSWAPEPEKKTPTRTYGLGRDRDFGPRTPLSADSKNLPKDTVVNMRPRAQTQVAPPPVPAPVEPIPTRNRLQKKNAPPQVKSPIMQPLQERPNYNSSPLPNPPHQQPWDYIADHNFYGRSSYDQATYTGSYAAMSEDALSREISSIDIGGSRHARSGSVPAPTAYVPVRSHKDRKTLF